MKFTVLGSGTPRPVADRGPAGFVVEFGKGAAAQRFLVDGGSGTLQRCARAGVDPCELDGGFYTHRHPDHCADLAPLLFAMRVAGRSRDYPIWAGEGFAVFFELIGGVYGRGVALRGAEVVVHELPLVREGRVEGAGWRVISAPANHEAGALHLRFESEGASVVFSGDTGPSEALVTLATGADLLVCECGTSDEDPYPGHLSPSMVAEIARRARPRAVWLTHLFDDAVEVPALEAISAVGVPVRRAADGDEWSPLR